MRLSFLLAAAFLAGAASAQAAEFRAGDLVVVDPVIFETFRSAPAAGGFMTIRNEGAADDVLEAVRAPVPRVEIHRSEVDEKGMATMTPVDGLPVPAGGTVELRPGGLHVMFMGLKDMPLKAGDTLPATLVFRDAGEVEIVFDVVKRGEGVKMMKHGDH